MNLDLMLGLIIFIMVLAIIFVLIRAHDMKSPTDNYRVGNDTCHSELQFNCGVRLWNCDSGKTYQCVSNVESY